MNTKNVLFFLLLSLIWACEEDRIVNPAENKESGITKSEYSPALENPIVEKGTMRLKLKRAVGEDFSIVSKAGIVQSNVTPFNTFLRNVKATGMERLFPYAGKFEKRTRKEGLHLWYVVNFDKNVLVANALSEAKRLDAVEMVEDVYQLALPDNKAIEVAEAPMADEKNPFNDPRLSDQWHYQNFGKFPKSIKGADINLFKAWEEETGKPNVIVCVVDGGIDFNHEDIKDNMHINLKEKNGQEGVDDDNNGYVDDIYGFNFVDGNGTIVPQRHGTHVAGTVAARNNNGIGVCGVAGGDGSPESGVRLISAQMFKGNSSRGGAQCIKYGADAGAVISQNSWGYIYPGPGYTPPSEKAAIDYFVKYAGCDNEGNQLADSPMKGGVVIFAAGNDDKEYYSAPSAYPPAVAVTAMAPNYERAYYSNYGDWADIMAPGGDDRFVKGEVLSTLPNNTYGYMQGTSMACPHVSGIAALIVSKFGKQGFTNTELKERLLSGLLPVSIDKTNPKHVGKLGIGYIDAKAVLAPTVDEEDNKAPGTPKFVEVKADFTKLTVVWGATTDENDGMPIAYNLYYSDKSLSAGNYKEAESVKVAGWGYKAGTAISYLFTALSLNTEYYFAIEAVDRWGAVSGVTFTSGKTKENHVPIIKRADETPIRIKGKETATLKLLVNEPDGQKWFYEVTGFKRGVSYTQNEKDGFVFKFRVSKPLGKHSLKVIVRDVFKATAEIEIPFEYYENEPPVLSKEFNKIFAPVNKDYTIDLNKFFKDPEGKEMTFSAKSSNSFVGVSVNGSTLSIKPTKLGMASVEITAKDVEGAEVSGKLDLQAVNDALVYLVYPIPVTKMLNLQLSNEVTTAKVMIRTLTGKTIFEETLKVTDGDRHKSLNLEKVSGGTYVLVVEANSKKFTQNFVKY